MQHRAGRDVPRSWRRSSHSGESARLPARSGHAARAAAAAYPAAGKAGDLPPHGRRAEQLELFDYKPELAKLDGKDCPQSFLEGKRFAFIRGVPKMLGPQYPFQQAGRAGRGSPTGCRISSKHVDEVCFIRSMHTDQFNHAPAQLLLHTGNARSASLARLVGDLRPRHGEPESARLHRADSGGNAPDAGKRCGARAFCPAFIRACSAAPRATRCSICPIPHGVGRELRRALLDAIDRMNQRTARRVRRSRNARRASRNTKWLSACRRSGDRCSTSRSEPAARSSRLRHRTRRRQLRQQLPARPPARRTRRAVRAALSLGLGFARRGAGEALNWASRISAARSISRSPRCSPTSKQRGLARRHAGRLGRRVRPHADAREPRRPGDALHRPRPQPARVHDLDGRRRREAGRQLRRDRRDGLRGRAKIPWSCATCTRRCSIYWASITTSSISRSRASTRSSPVSILRRWWRICWHE